MRWAIAAASQSVRLRSHGIRRRVVRCKYFPPQDRTTNGSLPMAHRWNKSAVCELRDDAVDACDVRRSAALIVYFRRRSSHSDMYANTHSKHRTLQNMLACHVFSILCGFTISTLESFKVIWQNCVHVRSVFPRRAWGWCGALFPNIFSQF